MKAKTGGWAFDEKELREDVKDNLPQGWELRVFLVTSGDSGKKYWVQYLYENELSHPDGGDRAGKGRGRPTRIMLCDCPEGKFKQPLTVLSLKGFWCKHAEMLYGSGII